MQASVACAPLPMPMKPALAITVAATVLTASAPALAEARASEVWIELGFNTRSPGGARLTTWAPNLGVFTELDSDMAMSATWGLTALALDDAEAPSVKPLNPFVAVHWTPEWRNFDLRLGLGAALPLAEANDEASRRPYESARALRGSWDPWLYEPDTVSFAVPARLTWRPIEVLRFAAEGAGYVLVDTSGEGERFGVQGAMEAAITLEPAFALGSRLIGLTAQGEASRTAVEPFVCLGLGPVMLRGRVTLNLGDLTTLADADGVWGAHFGVGYTF